MYHAIYLTSRENAGVESYLQNTFIDRTPIQHSHKSIVQHLSGHLLNLCPKVKI